MGGALKSEIERFHVSNIEGRPVPRDEWDAISGPASEADEPPTE